MSQLIDRDNVWLNVEFLLETEFLIWREYGPNGIQSYVIENDGTVRICHGKEKIIDHPP